MSYIRSVPIRIRDERRRAIGTKRPTSTHPRRCAGACVLTLESRKDVYCRTLRFLSGAHENTTRVALFTRTSGDGYDARVGPLWTCHRSVRSSSGLLRSERISNVMYYLLVGLRACRLGSTPTGKPARKDPSILYESSNQVCVSVRE